MCFSFEAATTAEAGRLSELHIAVAEDLTRQHGAGPWTSRTTTRGMLYAMRRSKVFVARQAGEIVGTLHLTTRKPWSINTAYFTECPRPLYLIAMAVDPKWQRQGIGRRCLEAARKIAWSWPADVIRLDAFDAEAGAGPFYSKCGWTEVGRARYRNTPLIYFEQLNPQA